MKLFWRTYCMKCGFHLTKDIWTPYAFGHVCRCPSCETAHEKGMMCDIDEFHPYIKIINYNW